MKNMSKSLVAAGVLLAMGLSSASLMAEETASPLSANAAVVTNYVFRGVTVSDEGPALQGGLDYVHESGAYAGTWLSTMDTGADKGFEYDLYLGYAGGMDDIGYDVGYIRYATSDESKLGKPMGELYVKGSYDMFNAGIRPSVHAGLSVSRVGGAAQTKVIKKLGGGIRLALSQYRELAAFAQFASDLDDSTRAQLDRGQRVTELMKQSQYSPLSVGGMAVSLFAADAGFLDDVELLKIGAFESALLDHVKSVQAELFATLNEGSWNDDLQSQLTAALEEFKATGSW